MVDFELLLKYFSGQAVPEEAMQVEDFAAAAPDQYVYFKSLHESWMAAGGEHYELPDVRKEWELFRQKHVIHKVIQKPVHDTLFKRVGIAAALLLLVALPGYFLLNPRTDQQKLVAAGTADSLLLLKDGTRVTLSPHATLSYPGTFTGVSREVTLHGDAFFEVSARRELPFMIHLPHELRVYVTGTSFTIRQRPAEVVIDLKEGHVLFFNPTDTLRLTAGNTGSYLVTKKTFLLQQIAPLTGSFNFTNASLEAVARQLNQHFQVHIQLQNAALAHCQFSAGFEGQTLNEILEAISATFNLNYTIENKNIYINGTACH